MNSNKRLHNPINGWFPQEPILRTPFQIQGSTKSSNPKPAFWENLSRFVSGIFIIELLCLEVVQFNGSWNPQINLIFIALWIGLTVFFLKRKNGFSSWFSAILFVIALAVIALEGLFFWFSLINFTGYAIISTIILSSFSLLYAWSEKLRTTVSHPIGSIKKQKLVSTVFVLIGILFLMFSLALTSHAESKLSSVTHNENILSQSFYLTQQIPDTKLSVNLTTQNHLAFFILPGSVVPHSSNYSSIDFSISYQPPLGGSIIKVYERSNISCYTHDPTGSWSVPQNGTYNLNFHYNYNEKAGVEENVGKYWSTIEPVPTTVYTPLLASYMLPFVIIASALLIMSVTIPIQQMSARKSEEKQNSEFTNRPPS